MPIRPDRGEAILTYTLQMWRKRKPWFIFLRVSLIFMHNIIMVFMCASKFRETIMRKKDSTCIVLCLVWCMVLTARSLSLLQWAQLKYPPTSADWSHIWFWGECGLTTHTQHVRREGPHLLSRNAVGGAARLVSNFGNDRSAAGFAKKGKCRPCSSCLDYFNFFLRTFSGFGAFLQIRPQQTAQSCRRTRAPNLGPSTRMIMSYTRWLVRDS